MPNCQLAGGSQIILCVRVPPPPGISRVPEGKILGGRLPWQVFSWNSPPPRIFGSACQPPPFSAGPPCQARAYRVFAPTRRKSCAKISRSFFPTFAQKSVLRDQKGGQYLRIPGRETRTVDIEVPLCKPGVQPTKKTLPRSSKGFPRTEHLQLQHLRPQDRRHVERAGDHSDGRISDCGADIWCASPRACPRLGPPLSARRVPSAADPCPSGQSVSVRRHPCGKWYPSHTTHPAQRTSQSAHRTRAHPPSQLPPSLPPSSSGRGAPSARRAAMAELPRRARGSTEW